MTPELREVCEAYEAYRLRDRLSVRVAFKRLYTALEKLATAKSWQKWVAEICETMQEPCTCKRAECSDLHVPSREPGLYINGKSLQEIKAAEANEDTHRK